MYAIGVIKRGLPTAVRRDQDSRIGVRALRANLTETLRQARAGKSFLITSRDKVIAELRPPAADERPERRPGAMRGKIWMAPDFDEWPPDILDAMEGRG